MPATASERPIAVFDSGVGGLTVLHELLVALPAEDSPSRARRGLVTAGEGVVRSVERTLAEAGLLSERDGEGAYRFLCTGDVETFRTLGTRFLQMPLGNVEQVELLPVEAAA